VQLLPGDIRKRDLHKVAGVPCIFTHKCKYDNYYIAGDIRKMDLHKVAGVAGIFTLSVCNL
jgi:hypothetical protein